MIARALVVAVVAISAPAFAQSRRYPPDAVDPDREAARHSKVWEDALDPGRTPYQQLVHDGKQLADEHTADGNAEAFVKLERAVALLPHAPDAYVVRGELELRLAKWDKCADDLAAAEARTPPDDKRTAERPDRRFELGICQSRAGRYADAERTLVAATAGNPSRGNPWLRLGEVRIAMGKLDEAIAALDVAVEVCTNGCDAPVALVHFLLAAAHDRARRPSEAEQDIRAGMLTDRVFAALTAPSYPLLGAGEPDYLLALAHRYEPVPHVEYALVHFRRFLKLAVDSPWRRRAEEHLRELSGLDYPQTLEKRAGSAKLEIDAARAAAGKSIPAMRACLAKLPTTVIEVTVTRDGPRTPDTARDQSRARTPPAGAGVREVLELDNVVRDDVDAAMRCIQPLAERMTLPVPTERDKYYIVAFQLAAP